VIYSFLMSKCKYRRCSLLVARFLICLHACVLCVYSTINGQLCTGARVYCGTLRSSHAYVCCHSCVCAHYFLLADSSQTNVPTLPTYAVGGDAGRRFRIQDNLNGKESWVTVGIVMAIFTFIFLSLMQLVQHHNSPNVSINKYKT